MTDPNLIQVIEQGFESVCNSLAFLSIYLSGIFLVLWFMLLFKRMH
jgi:hypothetical protein